MDDTLVLDTNSFNARGFPYYLSRRRGRNLLPAVAAAEFYDHVQGQRGWDAQRFREELRAMRVVVEPLDSVLATLAVEAIGRRFSENSADALIGAHALAPGRLLVTHNLTDFPQVARKATPLALMRRAS